MEFRKIAGKAEELIGYSAPVIGMDVRAYYKKKRGQTGMNAGDWALAAYQTAVIATPILFALYKFSDRMF